MRYPQTHQHQLIVHSLCTTYQTWAYKKRFPLFTTLFKRWKHKQKRTHKPATKQSSKTNPPSLKIESETFTDLVRKKKPTYLISRITTPWWKKQIFLFWGVWSANHGSETNPLLAIRACCWLRSPESTAWVEETKTKLMKETVFC